MISINVWKVDYSIYDFCPINILDSRNQWNALSNLFLSLKPQHKIDRPLMIYLPESCGVCLWKSFGPVWLFATSWAVACQAPLSMGISQARTPDWLAISFSRGLSQPRDWTQVSCIAGRFFTIWATTATRAVYGWNKITYSQVSCYLYTCHHTEVENECFWGTRLITIWWSDTIKRIKKSHLLELPLTKRTWKI